MPRVLVNFPARILDSPPPGSPDHRMYGVSHFRARGYEPVGPARTMPGWMALGASGVLNARRRSAGARTARREFTSLAESVDLVFSPTDILGLSGIHTRRALGLLATPLVTLMHSAPYTRGGRRHRPAWRPLLRGSDALPCMSAATAAAIARRPGCRHKVSTVVLGPDSTFPVPAALYPGDGVVSIGSTLRDFPTLVRACNEASLPCTIVCPAGLAAGLPPHTGVADVVVPDRDRLPYADVLALIAAARVVAIPLQPTGLLAGHWSLLDAMMVGKPVIMTTKASCGIDIETEGMGFWVEPGDATGWATAMRRVHDDPALAEEMGRTARRRVDEGLDSRRFADGIMDVFDRLLGIDTRRDTAASAV